MATLRNFWLKLLRAFPLVGRRGPHWVEPSNEITRAVYQGQSFPTFDTWDQPFEPAAPAPVAEGAAPPPAERPAADAPAAPAEKPADPKRPGVAA